MYCLSVLPPGVNPTAVDKYVNIKIIVAFFAILRTRLKMHGGLCLEILTERDSLESSGVEETTSLA
jgi:hypothetical protein